MNLQAKDINSSIFGAKLHAQNATTGSRKLKRLAGSLKKGGEVVLADHPKSVSDCNHLHDIAFKSCGEINKLTPTLEVALVVFFRFSTILKKIRKKAPKLNDIMNNLPDECLLTSVLIFAPLSATYYRGPAEGWHRS